MVNRRYLIAIEIGAAAVIVLLAALNLIHGNLNQDEGWYLYASRMVGRGASPYVDFAFTQGPVLPYVYHLFHPVIDALGVAGGRLVTTWFGIFSGLLAAATVARMVDRSKVFICMTAWILIGCNVYQSYFTTVVKTYGLCAFFLMGGFFALTYRNWTGALLAGACMALAAGTRLSAGIVLPISGIWLILQRERRWHWVWFGLGGGLTLLAVFAPFFAAAFDQTSFGLFGYHAGRDPGGLKALLILKMGFLSRFVQAYFVFTVLTLAALIWRPKETRPNADALLLWACGIGISLVHFTANFPYDDYQAIAYPVLVSALVLTLAPRVAEAWQVPVLAFLLLISVASAFSSPINQDWFVRGRDRIWWNFKAKSDLALLEEAAAFVRAHSPEGSTLLTQDVYLAVEANRTVPPGMEMGPFCYYPDLSRDQAEKLHLVNRELLLEIIARSDAPLAAVSGYGLAIQSPAVMPVSNEDEKFLKEQLDLRYSAIGEYPHFGQAHTMLTIYRRRMDN